MTIEFDHIAYLQNGPLLAIIFNRPKEKNALSPELMVELLAAMEKAANDETVEVVIVTGTGKTWSIGVDFPALAEKSKEDNFNAEKINEDANAVIHLIQTMPKPVIAALNGDCFAGAMELMMAFDCIIAAEEATIGDTHAKMGILPKWGMPQRLSQLVGPIKARELAFSSVLLSGREAAKIGLINKAVPLDKLDETVNALVKKMLNNDRATIAAIKQAFTKK